MEDAVPPTGFVFTVQVLKASNSGPDAPEASFQEVSGISTEISTEKIVEGGENRFAHKVPGRIRNDNNLVLKLGLITTPSEFGKWCTNHFSQDLNTADNQNKIEVKDLVVHLFDMVSEKPIKSWAFSRAYPVKWEIANLNAAQNEIVVESLTLVYAYFVEL